MFRLWNAGLVRGMGGTKGTPVARNRAHVHIIKKMMHDTALPSPHIRLPPLPSVFLHACTPLAGGMAAYDDNNWMQILESLNLSESDFDKASILLAFKDAGFRQGMLGGSRIDSNKRVILKALGELFLLPTIVRHRKQAWGSPEVRSLQALVASCC